MIRFYSLQTFPQRANGLLEMLRLPVLHMSIHTVPANKYCKARGFLALIFEFIGNPASATASISFCVLLDRGTKSVPFLFES